MCGICGFYLCRSQERAQPELLQKMTDSIIHRGPNDVGTYIEDSLALGMRRLSIIDVDGGHQPIYNEDQSICVVFNGEIYNFKSLRDKLIKNGHTFKTNTDTEVLVHLYEEQGIDFLKALNGMFTIALWDKNKKRLLLARDRLGQKPLYYSWTRRGLVFGSELKCLLHSPCVERKLNHQSILQYFTLGYICNPNSIYKDIQQVQPGGYLLLENKSLKTGQFWQLDPTINHNQDFHSQNEKLMALLRDSVKLRMISDVPLGAFLSGGLDSSLIVALMAEISSKPIKTFFIDFDNQKYSERKYAKAIASHFGTEHHELTVRPSAVGIIEKLVGFFDEPFGDSSAIPTYHVSQMTKEHVTVALSGDAGDECFGGYKRYQQILNRRVLPKFIRNAITPLCHMAFNKLPYQTPGKRYLRQLGMSQWEHYCVGTNEIEARQILSQQVKQHINGSSTYHLLKSKLEKADRSDALSPYTFLDLHYYLPDDILVKVDRMSMAHSLEVRSPLLDHRIVEMSASMPKEFKIHNNETKYILKQLFKDKLPPITLEARKHGFSIPLDEWFRGPLKPMLEECLSSHEIINSNIFNLKSIRQFEQENSKQIRNRGNELWQWLFFARWWIKNQQHITL